MTSPNHQSTHSEPKRSAASRSVVADDRDPRGWGAAGDRLRRDEHRPGSARAGGPAGRRPAGRHGRRWRGRRRRFAREPLTARILRRGRFARREGDSQASRERQHHPEYADEQGGAADLEHLAEAGLEPDPEEEEDDALRLYFDSDKTVSGDGGLS